MLHFVPAILRTFAIRPIGLLAQVLALSYVSTSAHAMHGICAAAVQELIQYVCLLDKTEQKSLTWICSVRISNFYRGNCALTFFLGPAFSARPMEFSSCLFARSRFQILTEETGLLLFSRSSFFSPTEGIQLMPFFSVEISISDRGNRAFAFILGPAFSARPRKFSSCLFPR